MEIKKRLEQMKSQQNRIPTSPENAPSDVEAKPSLATNWVDKDPSDPKTNKHPCKIIVTSKVIKIIQTDTSKKMIFYPSPEDITTIKQTLNG